MHVNQVDRLLIIQITNYTSDHCIDDSISPTISFLCQSCHPQLSIDRINVLSIVCNVLGCYIAIKQMSISLWFAFSIWIFTRQIAVALWFAPLCIRLSNMIVWYRVAVFLLAWFLLALWFLLACCRVIGIWLTIIILEISFKNSENKIRNLCSLQFCLPLKHLRQNI